jgi:anti-anti-sigma regulatory factor
MTEAYFPSLHLPPVLDLLAAASLCEQLQARLQSGEPIDVDASEVERVSTPCLQVLTSALLSARSRGLGFTLRTPSPTLVSAFVDLGLEHHIFS